jgi:hypothetical protein
MTKPYKSSHRLPSGERTKCDTAYAETYDIMAQAVLKYFPGFEFRGVAHNYGLMFGNREMYESGKCDFFNEFTLPLEACRSLLWGKVPDRVRRFDL